MQLTNLLERAGSQEAFDRQLKAVGMTPDELRTQNHAGGDGDGDLDARTGRHRDAMPTPSNFYAEHPADFEQPEMVHVRHILLLTMDPATHAPLPADQIAGQAQAD